MDDLDLIGKLMFGLGAVIAVYTIVYGLLIWRGFFSDSRIEVRARKKHDLTE